MLADPVRWLFKVSALLSRSCKFGHGLLHCGARPRQPAIENSTLSSLMKFLRLSITLYVASMVSATRLLRCSCSHPLSARCGQSESRPRPYNRDENACLQSARNHVWSHPHVAKKPMEKRASKSEKKKTKMYFVECAKSVVVLMIGISLSGDATLHCASGGAPNHTSFDSKRSHWFYILFFWTLPCVNL